MEFFDQYLALFRKWYKIRVIVTMEDECYPSNGAISNNLQCHDIEFPEFSRFPGFPDLSGNRTWLAGARSVIAS